MKRCEILAPETLSAWLDGERLHDHAVIEGHVQGCEVCNGLVASWQEAGDSLRSMVQAGTQDANALEAVEAIHQRIRKQRSHSGWARWNALWADLWLLHRRWVQTMAFAMALGALVAPVALLWGPGERTTFDYGDVSAYATVIESLEVGGDTVALVFQPRADSSTTVIWVEAENAQTMLGDN